MIEIHWDIQLAATVLNQVVHYTLVNGAMLKLHTMPPPSSVRALYCSQAYAVERVAQPDGSESPNVLCAPCEDEVSGINIPGYAPVTCHIAGIF